MSVCAQKCESSFVSYEAFEVACHALESYCERLMDSQVEKLKVYNAAVHYVQYHAHAVLQHWILTVLTPKQNRRFIVIEPHSRPY